MTTAFSNSKERIYMHFFLFVHFCLIICAHLQIKNYFYKKERKDVTNTTKNSGKCRKSSAFSMQYALWRLLQRPSKTSIPGTHEFMIFQKRYNFKINLQWFWTISFVLSESDRLRLEIELNRLNNSEDNMYPLLSTKHNVKVASNFI